MKRIIFAVGALLSFASLASDASAVIGRPLTPMSYAGVARRTTRRAVYAGAAYSAASYATTTATIATLPAGCVDYVSAGVAYKHCGSTYYRPYYDGPNVVYSVATP
jgi:hypothetical protein